jgi:hypothetical protein
MKKGIYPEKVERVVKKYKSSYYHKEYNIVDCANSEELKSICKDLGIDYEEDYCVVDTPVDHKLYL